MEIRRGLSYQKRCEEVNRLYDKWSRTGLSNREVWRRYIYPVYGISERTFYNLIGRDGTPKSVVPDESRQYFLFKDEDFL